MALPPSRVIGKSIQALDLAPVVTSITSLLQNLNPKTLDTQNLSSEPLNRFSTYLDTNLVTQVINKQTNPYHALFFFNWASNPNPNPNNYTHTNRCYEAITNLLLSHSLFSPAIQLLEKSGKLSDFFIGKIIKAYGNKGDIKAAFFWFNKAKALEQETFLFSFNAILGVLVKASEINLLKTLFDEVVEEGLVQPDVSSYTALISGLCKVGMVDNAKKVFDEMSCKRNLVTFNAMMNGYCKKGDMENAYSLFNQMMMNEEDCLPNLITYNTLIDGYCKKGEFEEATKYMNKMEKAGCLPNVMTYRAIIYGLCIKGKVDEAKKMISKMRLNGLKDDTAIHVSILKGLCAVWRPEEAIEYFRWMESCKMDLDAHAYGLVVYEYCKLGKTSEALLLLEEMRRRGVRPKRWPINSVLRTLVEQGQLSRAVKLLERMPRFGCLPNFMSYRTVICNLCKGKGKMIVVNNLVDKMLKQGLLMDATMYNCILERYSKDENEEKAVQVLNEMIGMKYIASLESFSSFVKMLSAKGMIDKGEIFFEDICRTCPTVDRDSYRRVLDEQLATNNTRLE
ncbi:hypothetical protein COLO4_03754 [Corchorus olitorius]|uniref:Pentacotripeptide-repeat region of PRORP domain-containing protein n=1 Tax=Corchorus olitorius TaxID=93759 RepID=A0A1R3KWT3_9ROSI|nr:hypothetical protein COLO4_03754 [Corchorus olitorius]